MRFRLWQRRGFWVVVFSLLALCLVVSGRLADSPAQAEPGSLQDAVVDIAVVPSSTTVQVNDTFTLDIYVYPYGQQVDTVDVGMTFDPTYLEVLSITGDSLGLDIELYSDFDNLAGTLAHSRGKLFSPFPDSTFRLCSIVFLAEAATGGMTTTLAFDTSEAEPFTGAYFGGDSILRDTTNGTVIITSQATLVDIAVVPSSTTVYVGETFTLDIYVYPNGQQVDTVDVGMTFDRNYLEVLSITGDSSGLDIELYSAFDNLAGTLAHSRGTLGPSFPDTDFRLCSIVFLAEAATGGMTTTLAFDTSEAEPFTGAYFEGDSVLRDTTNGTVCCLFGDLDGDGDVDIDDVAQVASRWRCKCGDDCYYDDPRYDMDSDCDVDIVDIMLVVAHWGETCE